MFLVKQSTEKREINDEKWQYFIRYYGDIVRRTKECLFDCERFVGELKENSK